MSHLLNLSTSFLVCIQAHLLACFYLALEALAQIERVKTTISLWLWRVVAETGHLTLK